MEPTKENRREEKICNEVQNMTVFASAFYSFEDLAYGIYNRVMGKAQLYYAIKLYLHYTSFAAQKELSTLCLQLSTEAMYKYILGE